MKTPAKRLALPFAGALVTSSLIGASFAGSAQAAPDWSSDPLTNKRPEAYAVANFWLDANGAALKKASQYNWDAKDVTKLVRGSGDAADGKPGTVAPIGGQSGPAAKVKNINLPKTIGKVFFVTSKGEYRWCSATSIQARYRNLVATAGHCVYDIDGNEDVMRNWVFVPGYYQGKAPWGIYVGQTAFTHYDLATYEDFDRDYAFVAVYNGVQFAGKKEVVKSEFNAWAGGKWIESEPIDAKEYAEGLDKYGVEGPYWKKLSDPDVQTVGKPADADKHIEEYIATGRNGVKLTAVEVSEGVYNKAPKGLDNNAKFERKSGAVVAISLEEYRELAKAKADGNFLGTLTATKDKNGNEIAWYKSQFYIKKWVKTSVKELYFRDHYFIGLAKDVGRLGDVVGGQGVAWNQPVSQKVYAFGYPADAHPDGDKPFTGLTPKWCYGKTAAKTYTVDAYKVANHIALKCSMTGGADGAPWLIKYNNGKRLGYVNGVTSLFHDQDANDRVDYNSSPYFDGETAGVYNQAQGTLNAKIVSPKGELLK
ncbi:hypothetical protein HNP84_002425 [Thermocatellispora tengchongensis]|uniref:Serine protease n=1 Tax=Thermocatellispora tengchongensis TaxID=1073253 RepID=A0A840P154_9ACTN|nr:hypothetical protein [Thermocatellispora tengchongensis]MBB5132709.1 hypothetical protein [Thermocatellispora tengchongensis]